MDNLLIIAGFALVVWALSTAFQGGSDTLQGLGGVVDTSASSRTVLIAQAIATAEGFYAVTPGGPNRPQRNNNPGDMTADLIGKSVGMDGPFVVFANDADGWENLYVQVNAWLEGTSRFHGPNSTILDIAGLGSETGYTSTDQATWANTVAETLGVSPDTSLADISA